MTNPSLSERLRGMIDYCLPDTRPLYISQELQAEILQALDDNERLKKEIAEQTQRLTAKADKWERYANDATDAKNAEISRYRATIVQLEKERKEAVERVHALEASDRANEKEPF